MLNEGLAYHKGGELFTYSETDNGKTNGKDISSMNETECQAYLNKAIEDEDYELADKIRKQLEKFRE
jgi:protein-arginine kinase activator protein McsA